MPGVIISALTLMIQWSLMATSPFWRSTWCLIKSDRFVGTQPCNSILLRDIKMNIKRTLRTVGTRPITISATCCKKSPFSVTFSTSKSEYSISNPSLSVGKTALPPARSSHLILIWLPPSAPSYMRSPYSWDPKTAMMESILILCWSTSEYNSTIRQMQRTAWQYSTARERLWSIRVVTGSIYCWADWKYGYHYAKDYNETCLFCS